MKSNFFKFIVSGVLFIFITVSCSDSVLDNIGKNPNSPTEVPISLLMPQVCVSTIFGVAGTDLAWYSSVFVEHTTGVHGQLENADKRTEITSIIGNNSWNELYHNLLDLEIIIKRGSAEGKEANNWASVGMAKILKAYNFSVATDLWGKIPFKEALDASKFIYPKFDDQQSIYPAIQAILSDGISDLNMTSVGNPGDADLFYGGNTEAWIRAAWGLKARLFNRLSNVAPSSYSDSVLTALSHSFTNASQSMIFSCYNTDATGQNPWFQEQADRGHHAISKTIDDLLVSLNDPRRPLWFAPINGVIVAAPNGTATADQAGEIYSRMTTAYLTPDAPQPFLTFDEIKFLEAEAYLRKEDNTNAYAAYLKAVEEALIRANVSAGEIATYMAQPKVAMGFSNLTLNDIITQKYISFWLFEPIEAYNDYRRTGIPTMNNPVSPPPSRFPYANDEVSANPNVPQKTITDRVWWAIK